MYYHLEIENLKTGITTNLNINYSKKGTVNGFDRIYHFTLMNMSRSNQCSTNTTLDILGLLSDSSRHHIVYALELWLFREARKICNTTEKIQLRQVIAHQIIQPFMIKLSDEQRQNKKQYVKYIVYKTLKNIVFKYAINV